MKFLLPLIVIITISCSERSKTEEISEEELTQIALEEGDRISTMAQKALGSQLKKAISEGGPVHAVRFCNTVAYPILDSLTTSMEVTIKRASLRTRNPKDAPNKVERKILAIYNNQIANQQTPKPVVEMLDGGRILYAKPIMLNNPLCLNCHGEVGTQISTDTHQLIEELYPEDNAIGHKLGDMRGIWSITFREGDLVENLSEIKSAIDDINKNN
ncbi:MAG: DUF3365 domain-containing protein [Bacteroidota bacterium]